MLLSHTKYQKLTQKHRQKYEKTKNLKKNVSILWFVQKLGTRKVLKPTQTILGLKLLQKFDKTKEIRINYEKRFLYKQSYKKIFQHRPKRALQIWEK